MDSQGIGAIVGIIGAAIAALGLLLTWYRSDKSKAPPFAEQSPSEPWYRRIRTRRGTALSVASTIAALTVVGVAVAALSPSAPTPGQATPLSEAQYRSELTRACLDADDEAQRIVDTDPANTVFGVNVNVERHLVDRVRRLVPPKSLRAIHDDLVGTWDRRLAMLDSVYTKLGKPGTDYEAALASATELANRVTELSATLGVPECGFG